MGIFSKLFGARDAGKAQPQQWPLPPLLTTNLIWSSGTSLPIPDWQSIEAPPETSGLHAFWSSAARSWLERLREQLGATYHLSASDHFMMLAPVPDRTCKLILDHCERSRRQILHLLDGIALDEGYGHSVIIMFATQDEYYDYVSNYYDPEGEFSTSGGMFLDRGYGHFVFPEGEMAALESTVTHELTHCYVRHLPIPAWVNEGLAVNTETRIVRAPYSVFSPQEVAAKHARYWNSATIQEFWNGKSWLRPGDSNLLSYDLAQKCVALLARDFDVFRKFVHAAHLDDGGAAASLDCFAYPVENLAAAILGEGDWAPDPSRWSDGAERGQFELF